MYQSITLDKYKRAELMCREFSVEVEKITIYFNDDVLVECKDGQSAIMPKDIKWSKI